MLTPISTTEIHVRDTKRIAPRNAGPLLLFNFWSGSIVGALTLEDVQDQLPRKFMCDHNQGHLPQLTEVNQQRGISCLCAAAAGGLVGLQDLLGDDHATNDQTRYGHTTDDVDGNLATRGNVVPCIAAGLGALHALLLALFLERIQVVSLDPSIGKRLRIHIINGCEICICVDYVFDIILSHSDSSLESSLRCWRGHRNLLLNNPDLFVHISSRSLSR